MNPARRERILVVDDLPEMNSYLRGVLGDQYEIFQAESGDQALTILDTQDMDLLIADIIMPGISGMELLDRARQLRPNLQIILMSGYGTVQQAVQAVKAGAFDYLTKPFQPDELLDTTRRALEHRRRYEAIGEWPGVVGSAPPMRRVFSLMESVRESDVTVLITGESGTGKGVIARALHSRSRRSGGRLVPVNCGAIPRDLMESELMGHTQGAFSGATTPKRGLIEEAGGGTLFLDEISEMPLDLQVKMNCVIQDKEVRRIGELAPRKVDVRFIAASNRDLQALVNDGRFREDLFYRLNVFPIHLPALRERTEDIPALAQYFLGRASKREGLPERMLDPRVEQAFMAHSWPGNIRELENLLDRAVLLASGERLLPEHFPASLFANQPAPAPAGSLANLTLREASERVTDAANRSYLENLLTMYNGNVTRAAEHAGIERQSMHRLLKRHGILPQSYRK